MASNGETLVKVEGLYKEFPIHAGLLEELSFEGKRLTRKRESVKALNGVDLEVIDLQEESSFAKIITADKQLKAGQRVEAGESE